MALILSIFRSVFIWSSIYFHRATLTFTPCLDRVGGWEPAIKVVEHSRLVHIQGLVLDCEAFDILIVLVSQAVFDEEVGDLELLLDHGDHVRCEMVHGALYVDVSSLL